MPTEDEDEGQDIWSFRTEGTWTVADLESCLGSAKRLYNAALAARLWRVRESAIFEWYRGDRRGPWPLDMLRRMYLVDFDGNFFIPSNSNDLDHLIADPEAYASDEDKLKVQEIHIASPGGWDLVGIAAIITTLNAVAAYWMYQRRPEARIKQLEGDQKELELLERELRLRVEFPNVDFPPVSRLLDPYQRQQIQINAQAKQALNELAEHAREGRLVRREGPIQPPPLPPRRRNRQQ